MGHSARRAPRPEGVPAKGGAASGEYLMGEGEGTAAGPAASLTRCLLREVLDPQNEGYLWIERNFRVTEKQEVN